MQVAQDISDEDEVILEAVKCYDELIGEELICR